MCGQGGKPSEVDPRKGRRTTLCGLDCAYAEDNIATCTVLNLIQYNTFNSDLQALMKSEELKQGWHHFAPKP
jgi:hypothetical protein